MSTKLPQIVILYGPPAAGKGTQSHYLQTLFPDRHHLDFGSELRNFVQTHIGDYKSPELIINSNSSESDVEVAKRIKEEMVNSRPVDTDDLKYVIESCITTCVNEGKGMIVEGPGRLVEEAKWLSSFMDSKNTSVCIFHLHVSLDEVLRRSNSRYYLKGVKKPFKSYQEALEAGRKDGLEPYRRAEDEDQNGTISRYKTMYSDHYAQILSIYQLGARCDVFTLDGTQKPEEVSNDIKHYFNKFFNAGL